MPKLVKIAAGSERTAKGKVNKRGSFVCCGRCGGVGGKLVTPFVEKQEDGSEKKMLRVEVYTLVKDGDRYMCTECRRKDSIVR